MSVIQSPFRLSRKTRGFTLIEVLVVIAIIGILSVLGFVSYNGLQQRAAENGALSDLENAASVIEQYALKNGGEFPNSEYLSSNFTTTKGVNLSVVLSDAGDSDGTTTYTNLSPVQNGVLFYNLCSEIVNENRPDQPSLKYGQGINNGNQITTYIIGPNPCGVYNPTRIQVNSTWNPANFDTPITASSMQNFISSSHNTDAWFPDREHVEKQFY